MTSEQYYSDANKKIAELKAQGKDPFSKARDMIYNAMILNKPQTIKLKDWSGSGDPMEFVLKKDPVGVALDYKNGVNCHKLSKFSYPNLDDMGEQLTIELLAMSYNMDLTWKQYFIDDARARGYDV